MSARHVDVAIIGGGVHGCAIAYYLAKKGVRAALFESGYISSGSSGRSAAGVRYQFGTEVNILLAQLHMREFQTLEEQLGYKESIEYDPTGYLWVAYSESQMDQIEKNVNLQQKLGSPTEILDVKGIQSVAPYVNTEGMIGAGWCPYDGHVNPHTLCFAYADAARKLGAEVYDHTPVTGVIMKAGRAAGVHTAQGDWEADAVVCAANAWSPQICNWAGFDIPIEPERHEILITEPMERIKHPMTLCLDDGAYFKQCPNGTFMMGRDNPDSPKDTSFEASSGFLYEVSRRVLPKIPVLEGVRVVRQWTGPYAITPDHQAIVGQSPVEGLFLDCGWSGHGLQFGPSVGQVMAELVNNEKPSVDVSVFRFTRFAEGELYPEPACI